jgi:hypothetical protein
LRAKWLELEPIMPNTPPGYRLVIFEAIDEPLELRDVVCKATGMHPTDAVQWLGRAPGTWPKPLDADTVRALLDALYDAQIAAEAWRTDQFPDLSPARTIHRVACLNEGLRIEGLRAEPTHWIPWDRIELISAGRISARDEFRHVQSARWPSVVVSGIRALAFMKPQATARRARASRIPRDPVGEVIIIRRDPRIAFRAVETQINYAYLGESRSTSAAENFPVFLGDLCKRSVNAFITPSTHALLGQTRDTECEFPSSQSLLDYATHRLLWSWYQRDRDARAQSPPSDPSEDRTRHDDSEFDSDVEDGDESQ